MSFAAFDIFRFMLLLLLLLVIQATILWLSVRLVDSDKLPSVFCPDTC